MPDHLPRVAFVHHLSALVAAVEILTFFSGSLAVEMRLKSAEIG